MSYQNERPQLLVRSPAWPVRRSLLLDGGESGAAAAVGRFRASNAQAATAQTPPIVLGFVFSDVPHLAFVACDYSTSDGRTPASAGVSTVLALEVDAWQARTASDSLRRSRVDTRMSDENATWGAPRITAELALRGHELSPTTVAKYMIRPKKPPSPSWKTFLDNHAPDTAGCDFFVVPTAAFRMLYCFIVLGHDRRRIVHFNVTQHPSAEWTGQQIVNAFPYDSAPRYLLRDNDSIYGGEFSGVSNLSASKKFERSSVRPGRILSSNGRSARSDASV